MRHQRAFAKVLLCAGITGAAGLSAQVTTNFRAEHARLVAASAEIQRAKHLSEYEILHNRLLNPFASPGVRIQKVQPGGSVAVTVRGNFPEGTKILSERDGVTISGATQSTTTYSARLTLSPDEGPGFVRLWAFDPIGIKGPTAVALVETWYRIDLKTANGFTIKIAPVDKTFTMSDNENAQVKYQAEFYKPRETTPFETVIGDELFYVGDAPLESRTPYARLDFQFDQSKTSPQAELETITTRMSDPKITDAERNALMTRMGEVQQKMMEQMARDLQRAQTDPASLNKAQDDFGCGYLQLYPSKGGVVEGSFSCGKNFNGGVFNVTGTITQIR